MIILLPESVAKVLPVPYGEPNMDRAIIYIDDEMVRKVYMPEYCHDSFPIREMLNDFDFYLWGHTVQSYIRMGTIL